MVAWGKVEFQLDKDWAGEKVVRSWGPSQATHLKAGNERAWKKHWGNRGARVTRGIRTPSLDACSGGLIQAILEMS